MRFAGGTLANALFMVEAAAMLLLEAFDIFVLGHCGAGSCVVSGMWDWLEI